MASATFYDLLGVSGEADPDAAAAAEKAERQLHYMKCPKCGADLHTEQYQQVQVDRCPECDGIWFDAGEADSIVEHNERKGVAGLPPDAQRLLEVSFDRVPVRRRFLEAPREVPVRRSELPVLGQPRRGRATQAA